MRALQDNIITPVKTTPESLVGAGFIFIFPKTGRIMQILKKVVSG